MNIVTRHNLRDLLVSWQAGKVSTLEVQAWADDRYQMDDWDSEDDVTNEVLSFIAMLDINLITVNEVPLLLQALECKTTNEVFILLKGNHWRDQLIHSLQLMTAEYTIQTHALPKFVAVADEIALTFDQWYTLKDQLVEAGLITRELETYLDEINELTTTMTGASNKKLLWSLQGLKKDPRWAEVRQKAREALRAFKCNEAPHGMTMLSKYIKSRE